MKKALSTLVIVLLVVAAQAQIKVHDNGHVSLGDTQLNAGIQIQPSGYCYFKTRVYDAYSWASLSNANDLTQRHWIVSTNNGSNHLFYVFGSGVVWSKGYMLIPGRIEEEDGSKEKMTIGGDEAINILSGLRGYYYKGDEPISPEELTDNEFVSNEAVEGILNDNGKRKAGLSAEELEAVFPESVRTDPQARLGIDYVSVIAVLVEAVNRQQEEIERLREVVDKVERK